MRLPRMTTRRWMISVMILATLLGIFVEIKRELRLAYQYQLKAKFHALQEDVNQGAEFSGPAGMYAYSFPNPEVAAYHVKMRRKYETAAARPWKSVEPDPPTPKP